jgi:hypothetical protein
MQMPEPARKKNKPPVIHPPTRPYVVAQLSGIAVGIILTLFVGEGGAWADVWQFGWIALYPTLGASIFCYFGSELYWRNREDATFRKRWRGTLIAIGFVYVAFFLSICLFATLNSID